jgi:dipeptidyl aminopeptidase/acylaminoacyl peptidase
MKRFLLAITVIVELSLVLTEMARADLPPLIPRKLLFSNAARTNPELSPDGTYFAYLAPSEKGVSNIWLQTLGRQDTRMVTQDATRGIYGFQWAADSRHLLYGQDRNGDENWHIFSVDIASGLVRDLTPFIGIRARHTRVSHTRPGEILVEMNIRDRRVFDVYRVNLETGAVTADTQNPGDVLSWVTDENFIVRAATAFGGTDARTTIRVRNDPSRPWRDLMVIPFEDCSFYGQVNGGTLIAGFAPGGESLYVISPLGSERTRLVELDCKTGKELREIAAHPKSDVEYDVGLVELTPVTLDDPASGRIQGVGFNYTRFEWRITDPSIQSDIDLLQQAHQGTMRIINRVKNDTTWLVRYDAPHLPTTYSIYDRPQHKIEELFVDRPELSSYTLAQMEPVVVKARDGLDIVCYLTAPPGVKREKLPLVLLPHGGPWWRDRWEYDGWVQMLANRGYAVIQPEYRASTGFGKKFMNAGNRQFGNQAIMNDYLDVVKWAVDSGLADPDRLAVTGASGGGYATLCCLAFHPELWKCGVDLVGPSSVKVLLHDIPAYWEPVKQRWVRRFGDAEHDEAWNQKVSPLYHAAQMRAPLLMAYGANDARVSMREATEMAKAMRDNHREVTLVVYPDEGHSFARPENNLDCFGRMEDFLAKHLGGRKEPYQKVPGTSAEER